MKTVQNHPKKIIGGSVVAALVGVAMTISGCTMTYTHNIIGDLTKGLEESYKVELQTDDFIIKMREMDLREQK